MSRVANNPINVPDNVEITINQFKDFKIETATISLKINE